MPRITLVAALFGGAAAQLGSHQTLAGYQSASDVGPHSMIDLDMEELETFVGNYDSTDGTEATWLADALFVYENGGNGKCTQADVDDTANGHCTAVGGAKGNSLKSAPTIRTIKGFATKDYSSDKLTGVSDNGWYNEPLPKLYKAYWKAQGWTDAQANVWADTFITKDYSAISKDSGTNQLIKKGANYQAVWMYVLHELEDAIGDCYSGDILANDQTPTGGAPHAWDEGWAFYAGSQVAATAVGAVTDDGTLIWELSEKRADDFGTDDTSGPASVNVQLLAKFIEGRDKIIAADCAGAEPLVEDIRKLMTVPLVQGTLKYAFKADPANSAGDCTADASNTAMTAADGCVKSWSEGWAFAAAVLPQVYNCDQTAAATIKTNLDIAASGPMAGGFAAVKSAIEGTYQCLGITCAHVGKYSTTTQCTDPVASSDSATAPALALGAAAAAAGAAFLL
jgi:hypothetical protein